VRRHAIPAGLLAALVATLVLAGRGPASGEPLPAARHVLVVAVPHLHLRDLRDGPLRRATAGRAAVGAMSVRALNIRPRPAEGYLALGSGVRSRPPIPGSASPGALSGGRVDDIAAVRAANSGRRLGSMPGALAAALHEAGRDVVIAGDGAVALAGMDQSGTVTIARGAPAALARRHDLVIAAAPNASAAARLLAARPPTGTLVLLVSVSPAPGGALTPAAALGAGIAPGRLASESTRRAGIVTLGDVAPTILAVLGVPRPAGMDGRALRRHPGPSRIDGLIDLDARSLRQATAFRPLILAAGVALLVLVALSLAGARRPAATAALTVAALPLATYLVRLAPNPATDAGVVALTALVAAVVAALAAVLTRTPRAALTAVLALTAAVLALDGATGGWLHTTTILGYSLPGGGRFYGMPNSTFALLSAATVLTAGLLVERHGRAALPVVAVAFAVVALLNCLPGLGSDVGGLLTLTPVFGLAWLGLTGRRMHARHVAGLAMAALALFAALGAIDLLRPDAAQTHLGRLLAEVLHDGPGPLWDAIVRKESANLSGLHTAWSAGVLLVMLVPLLLRARLSPPLRAAVGANLVLTALGFALNDSGPVVVALGLFYLGPLLAIHRSEEGPGTVAATASTPPARARAAARRRASLVSACR